VPRRTIDLGAGRALLDIASYGRSAGRPLAPSQRRQIALTVRRAPEVMVKVSGGARSLGGVEAHFGYIGRDGELGVEVDHGFQLVGKGFERKLAPDWDLDLEAHRRQDARSIRGNRRASKLVHNLIFSMPPGTPAAKVLGAVRMFVANEFALKHRYALVLHTDEAHPHVHVVVKAVSEQGERLNIRKATLRHWREQFAAHLRELGVAANATERAVRGENRTPRKDAIYRTIQRGESTRERKEIDDLVNKSPALLQRFHEGREKLKRTRIEVIKGWYAVAQRIQDEGDYGLAESVRSFVGRMPLPMTDQTQLAQKVFSQRRGREVDPMERAR
jgi:hypothetical protein